MTQTKPKLDLKDLKSKNTILRKALHSFLEENSLTLSEQNFERAFQHLLACMNDHTDLSSEDVQTYLNEVLEYHAHTIDMMNKSGLAEDSLIKILVTADYEQIRQNNTQHKVWQLGWRALPMPVAVSLILLLGAALASPTVFPTHETTIERQDPTLQVINRQQEEEIKILVEQLESLSNQSRMKIYSDLKALPEITAIGPARSYKKFNQQQFAYAKNYLQSRINNLQNNISDL